MIRTWTPESENEKPPKNEKAQLVRAWFERLPRMRAQIQQQEERIVDLQCIATATTSSVSAAPGRSGTSDKVGNGGAAIVEAEEKLAALKFEYVEMQKAAIDTAYLLNADTASIRRSKCIILCYVEGKTREQAAAEVGFAQAHTASRAITVGFEALAEIWEATPFCDFDESACRGTGRCACKRHGPDFLFEKPEARQVEGQTAGEHDRSPE